MRKQIFAALIVLMMLLCGCSEATVVPTESNEVVSETEVTADVVTETESSLLPSESKETADSEETDSPETTPVPEVVVSEPPKEESKPKETAPAVTAPKESQNTPAAESEAPTTPPAVSNPPKETPKPAPPTPEPTPEETKPKSAYDSPFDISAIKLDCIGIGQGMGLSLDSSLTPSNATWWNPVTASQSNQGATLGQNLESYIKFYTVGNLGSYGIDEITSFNIYCEARGNGVYSIYFLFA